MNAFGLDTPDLSSFFVVKDGATRPTEQTGQLLTQMLAARGFAPGGGEDNNKTVRGVITIPAAGGVPTGPASALAIFIEAFKRDKNTAVFMQKTVVIPDTNAKQAVITTDSARKQELLKNPEYFLFAGPAGGGLLAAKIFGVPAWLLGAAAAAVLLMPRLSRRRY